MNAIKTVGKHKPPQTPAEFYAVGAMLDREIESLRSSPRERFVFRARTWDDLDRFQAQRLLARACNSSTMSEQAPLLRVCSLLNRADLLLIDANPLSRLSHTQRIRGVVLDGRLLQRADLDALLDAAGDSQAG